MEDNIVTSLAIELAKAVDIIMNPESEKNARSEAHSACEHFKAVSDLCAQVGYILATGSYSSHIKHFGLHLLEHTIKFKWNTISRDEKLFIKVNMSVFSSFFNTVF